MAQWSRPPAETNPNCIVAIGGSAGALEPFQHFFEALPENVNAAFVVLQHMDPAQKSLLPELLRRFTTLPILPAKDGEPVLARHIYVIEPGNALEITRNTFVSHKITNQNERLYTIDRFFISLAKHHGTRAIAILISGTGTDGTKGLRQIQEAGGRTLAQEPSEAKFPAMVESASSAGSVDRILPIREIAKILSSFVECSATTISESDQSSDLASVCEVLHQKTGHDFTYYKKSTVARRVERRLHANLLSTLSEYIEFLKQDSNECRALLRDLLISVTQFFRDKDAFEFLRETIFPKLFNEVKNRDTLRLWVPACATGEEAYSLAILILEYKRTHKSTVAVQIFATDIDRAALEYARTGLYPPAIADHVPPDYLARYFEHSENGFQASPAIREICVFAEHSLLKNPPFSRIDLVSCRNLFIYWEPDLQSKVLPVFHYALNPSGYLFLGPAENVTGTPELFRVLEKKFRLFQRMPSVSRAHLYFPVSSIFKRDKSDELTSRPQSSIERDPAKVIAANLLENYAPPAIVINEHGEIAYFSGDAGTFLGTPTGTPTNNIFDQIKRPLRPELHALVRKCVKTQQAVTRVELMFEHNSIPQKLNLSVRPLPELSEEMGLYLVVFQEVPTTKDSIPPEQSIISGTDAVVQQLESELHDTREHLQSTIEELKSSNEELLSMNEELQSANEELQTSKEELQSTNEELETVNAELFSKVDELDTTNSDLQNFFQNTQVPTIFLDDQARIQKFNPSINRVFRLIPNDIGRPIADITALIDENQLVPASLRVIETLQPFEKEVNAVDGTSQFIMRISPYRTLKNVISGVVITFADVTELKANENALKKANHLLQQEKERLNSLFLQAPAIINIQSGPEHVFTLVHPLTKQLLGRDVTGMKMRDAAPELESQGFIKIIDQVYNTGVPFHGNEVPVELRTSDGTIKKSVWNFIYQPWKDENGKTAGVMTFAVDVSEQVEARRTKEESQQQFQTLANSIPQLAWMANADGYITWYNDGWYSYTGTTPEQMEGWGWQRVHDPKALPSVLERWKNSIATGEPFDMEFPLRSKSGEFRAFLTRINPIRNTDGKVVRWFGTNTDIDEARKTREQLKESVSTLETLNNLGQTISAELDLEKLVQTVTDAATQLTRAQFGALFYNVTDDKGDAYTLYSLSGAPREAFEKFGLPRKTQVFAPTFDGDGVVRSDDITKDSRYGKNSPHSGMPQGHLPVKSYLAVPVISRSKEVIGGLFFGHPEAAIFSEKDENLVLGLAAQTATAIDNARLYQKSLEAIQARDTFLSIASHELKTPMTSLKLQAQIRKRSLEKGELARFVPEKLPQLFADDEKQINRLTRLVDDMLDITRIQTGKLSLQLERLDLYGLVRESVDRFSAMLQSAGSRVELDGVSVFGNWDRYRIEQIVTNLLTNAIKYGAGSKIQIQVRAEGESALLSIRDHGIGIAKEDHARIFSQFERAVSPSGITGFGLGLFIVKQLAESHNGQISVDSELGRGSTFTLKLPCEPLLKDQREVSV